MRALSLLLACLLAIPASAATLRPFTRLQGDVVRLSDLFEDPGADRTLGPAPALGARITVEAPQLEAIARQFGVDWRPASSSDRAILERPGRGLTRDEAIVALRPALGTTIDDAEIEVTNWVNPMVPAEGSIQPSVSQVNIDPANGRFTALLTVAAGQSAPIEIAVAGRVQDMLQIPVPRRRLLAGELILARDLQMLRMRAPDAGSDVVRRPEQAIGQAARRPVPPGRPILVSDLGRPILVHKGSGIRVVLDSPGLSLTANGVATEAGSLGETIRVLNPASRAIVEAEVIGPDLVRVLPGAVPVVQRRTAQVTPQ